MTFFEAAGFALVVLAACIGCAVVLAARFTARKRCVWNGKPGATRKRRTRKWAASLRTL